MQLHSTSVLKGRDPVWKGTTTRALGLILLLCVGPLVGNAVAATRYVRAGASGSGTGNDWANAYPSLPSTLVRGDTYYIADGNYGSYTFDDAVSGNAMIYIVKATATDHGTSSGWQASYGDGEAVFSASSGSIWTFNTGYYDINGVVGQGKAPGTYGFRVFSPQSRCSGADMVVFREGAHITNLAWRHIDFDWNNGTAACSSNVVAHFYTRGASSDYITIEDSYFHHSSGFVFYIGPYDPNPGGKLENHYTIRNNYFYMNGGGGSDSAHWETMWLMNFDNSVIANNVIQDTIGSSGQTGWVMLAKSDNVKIHGNLFYCASSECIIGGNGVIATWSLDAYQNNSVHIYNNTFVNLKGVFSPRIYFIHNSASDTDIQVKNNVYYNSKFEWAGVNTQSHESCGGGQSCRGTNQETGISTSKFVNFAGGNYRLASPTAAGDSSIASQFNGDVLDMDGNRRGADGSWDRGAFEFGNGGSTSQIQPPSNLRVTVE
jgi:hypothetical protein